MTRKGSKNLTESEKNLLISVINDYEVCDLSDQRMIEILSQKLGRGIKGTSYYALKSEAKKNRPTSEQWLDNYCRSGIVDFYKQRLDELLLVQRTLMKLYADEANKKDTITRQNRVLMAKLAKTVSDSSKNLSELGMSPVILAKLQSLIPKEIQNGNLEFVDKYFKNLDDNKRKLWSGESDGNECSEKDEKEIKLDPSKAPTALLPPIDGVVNNDNKSDKENSSETTAQGDQRIF